MRLRLGLFMALLGIVTAFQNCAESLKSNAERPGGNLSERVIGPASIYTKIVYDTQLESPRAPGESFRLEADVQNGQMNVLAAGTLIHQCQLDPDRLSRLRDLLTSASVCQPGPLPPGNVTCMAAAVADVELSNGSARVQLRPVVCNYGVFLCDGQDEILRNLLSSLRRSPPPGCT